MVTNNSWDSENPAQVAKGGTGAATLTGVLSGTGTSAVTDNTVTQYAVLVGAASNAVSNVSAVGTSGQVLTSNGAGVDPTFQAASGGVSGPGSSTDNALARWDGTGGDTLQDSTVTVTDNGEMTNTSQPCFMAHVGTTKTDVTGDDTTYVVVFDIEDFDQNSDYDNTTGVFTAPVGGNYMFCASLVFSGITTHTKALIQIFSNGGTSEVLRLNPTGLEDSAGVISASGMAVVKLDAAQVARVQLTVNGAAKVVDVPTSPVSYFSGALLC